MIICGRSFEHIYFYHYVCANYDISRCTLLVFYLRYNKTKQKKREIRVCVYEQSVVSGGHDITVIGCTFIQNVHVLNKTFTFKGCILPTASGNSM